MFKYFLVLCALLVSTAAQAVEQPKMIGEYGDWVAWTYNDRGNVICYMSSKLALLPDILLIPKLLW